MLIKISLQVLKWLQQFEIVITLVPLQRGHLNGWGQTGANEIATVPNCLHYYVSER